MPLTMANPHKELHITAIHSSQDMRMRLCNMGITAGIPVRVISRSPSSLLVGVRDTRIMLDFKTAHQIHVQ